jgi:DNA helicase-2/ATP-dependent DNA helicase PcrA
MLKDGSIENETRMENINELTTVLKKYEIYPAEEGLKLFLEEVALITDIDNYNANENAVTMMTLHSAKGLEFPVVFMAGMEENLFPHSSAIAEEREMAEERRLCYVGLTRAMAHLYLICTQTRHIFGSVYANMPSRFIEDIPRELVNLIDGEEPETIKTRSSKPSEKIVLDENNGEFRSGDKIIHEKFGEGRIVQVQGGIIKVAFANQGVKSLAASIAPIKKI